MRLTAMVSPEMAPPGSRPPAAWIAAGVGVVSAAALLTVCDAARAHDAVVHGGLFSLIALLAAGAGVGALVAAVGVLGWAVDRALPSRLSGVSFAAPVAVLGLLLVETLTSGPRISTFDGIIPLRWALRLAVIIGSWSTAAWGVRIFGALRRRDQHGLRTALLVVMGALIGLPIADAVVLPGLYASLHQAFAAAFIALSVLLGAAIAHRIPPTVAQKIGAGGVAVGILAIGALALGALPGDKPGMRQLLRYDAPWCTRLGSWLLPVADDPEVASDEEVDRLLPDPDPVDPALLDARLPDRRQANMVLITLDAVRHDHLGTYGHRPDVSPNLDRFAKESVVFERCWAQYPSSQLSVASMFTGLYPTATDVFELRETPQSLTPPLSTPPLARRLRDVGFDTAAVCALRPELLDALFAYLSDGFESFNRFSHDADLDAVEVTAHAQAALGRLGNRPWFLWVHYFDPHQPYREHSDSPFADTVDGLYDGEIRHMDTHLGTLLDSLRNRDDWDRTMVWIHADHGEELLDHGGHYHNSSLYEEQVRVPLIARIPGVPGARIERATELVDLVPTILELIDRPIPAGLHGQSLASLLLPETRDGSQGRLPSATAFTQFREPSSLSPRRDAVFVDGRKLIHHLDANISEVFDLANDPQERRNLVQGDPEATRALTPWLDAYRGLIRRRPDGSPMGERDALEATLRGTPAERRQALFQLLRRRNLDRYSEALIGVLDPTQPATVLQVGLEAVAFSPAPACRPQVEALVAHPDPAVRSAAALALAAFTLDAPPACLQDLEDDPDARSRVTGLIARGLLGDASVQPTLIELLPVVPGESRVLLDCALARLGHAEARARIRSILRRPKDVPNMFRWALRVVQRSPSPDMVIDLFGALDRVQHGAWWADPGLLLEATQGLPRQLVTPLLFDDLEFRGPDSRRMLLAATGGLRSPWRGLGVQVLRARESTKPMEVAEALLLACRHAQGFVPWDLGFRAWRNLVAAGAMERATQLAQEMELPASETLPGVRSFVQHLSQVADTLDRPAIAKLEVTWADPMASPGARFLIVVRLTLDKKGGGLPGGSGTPAPGLFAKVRPEGTRDEILITAAALPLEGLLPGESCEIPLLIQLPALPPGEHTLVVRLSRRIQPRPVCTALMVKRKF